MTETQGALRYQLVDVFTDRPFGGNPLAVFPDAGGVSPDRMQSIAKELNLSETTFVLPAENGGDARVRIFTPAAELAFAGHPTLGTAFVLARLGRIPVAGGQGRGVLELGVGPIAVTLRLPEGGPGYVEMEQHRPTYAGRAPEAAAAALLSVREGDLEAALPIEAVSCGSPFAVVPVRDLRAMRALRPRQDLWSADPLGLGCSAVLAFCLETEDADVTAHARMFAPWLGVIEDPATGSAAGPLGCYLVRHELALSPSDGDTRLVIEQGIEMGRPSRLYVTLERLGGEITGVRVAGHCVPIGRGVIEI